MIKDNINKLIYEVYSTLLYLVLSYIHVCKLLYFYSSTSFSDFLSCDAEMFTLSPCQPDHSSTV